MTANGVIKGSSGCHQRRLRRSALHSALRSRIRRLCCWWSKNGVPSHVAGQCSKWQTIGSEWEKYLAKFQTLCKFSKLKKFFLSQKKRHLSVSFFYVFTYVFVYVKPACSPSAYPSWESLHRYQLRCPP